MKRGSNEKRMSVATWCTRLTPNRKKGISSFVEREKKGVSLAIVLQNNFQRTGSGLLFDEYLKIYILYIHFAFLLPMICILHTL